jgi:hypothetical protein
MKSVVLITTDVINFETLHPYNLFSEIGCIATLNHAKFVAKEGKTD